MKKLFVIFLSAAVLFGFTACSYQQQVQKQAAEIIKDAQEQATEMNKQYQELFNEKLEESGGDYEKALELMNEELEIDADVENIEKIDWDDMMSELTEDVPSASVAPSATPTPKATAKSSATPTPTATPKSTPTPKPSSSAVSNNLKQYEDEIRDSIAEFPGWSEWGVYTYLEAEGLSDKEIQTIIDNLNIDWLEQARIYVKGMNNSPAGSPSRDAMIDLLENAGFEQNIINVVIPEYYD